jgi:hypothetical protein
MNGGRGVSEQKVAQFKRWRGAILGYVYSGLHDGEHRMDDLTLFGMMQDFNHGIGLNQVRGLLHELRGGGYLKFDAARNTYTGETEISKIEITPDGCKVVEKIKKDDSILIL